MDASQWSEKHDAPVRGHRVDPADRVLGCSFRMDQKFCSYFMYIMRPYMLCRVLL